MRDTLQAALDAATASGATYADVRGVDLTTEAIAVRGPTAESVERSHSIGVGVRVLVDGAWGFAATAFLENDPVTEVARRAVEIARASATASRRPVELVP